MANGSLHDEARAIQVMEKGADFIALGRGALANHDWPERVAAGRTLREFDSSIPAPLPILKILSFLSDPPAPARAPGYFVDSTGF